MFCKRIFELYVNIQQTYISIDKFIMIRYICSYNLNYANKYIYETVLLFFLTRNQKKWRKTFMRENNKNCKRKNCPYYHAITAKCRYCEWNPKSLWTEKKAK